MDALRACRKGSRNPDNGCEEAGVARQHAVRVGNRGGIDTAVVVLTLDLLIFVPPHPKSKRVLVPLLRKLLPFLLVRLGSSNWRMGQDPGRIFGEAAIRGYGDTKPVSWGLLSSVLPYSKRYIHENHRNY